MEKELSEMSLEELWKLFPIFLTEHKDIWIKWFEEEKSSLENILPQSQITRISHIGSTSISTIWAKPIIDILVEISVNCCMETIKLVLLDNGYTCMSQSEGRISFNKGYTKNGFDKKVFHLHLRYAGDNDELYFRDYLLHNKKIALEYEKLKLKLWKKYEHDRDGYTNAKTEFIEKYTQEAKRILLTTGHHNQC
ncbi:MAG: GrpB family protein [Lachnospiraceae bacterium]|nr:GrpB family protein [Lachnospiraceae bacterium]